MKLDNEKIKSMCMMVDLGEFKREEIAKQFGISKSHLDKLYRLNNTGNNDTFREKNILVQENEELRNKVEKLKCQHIELIQSIQRDDDVIGELKRNICEKSKEIEVLTVAVDGYRSVSKNNADLPDNVQKFVDKCKTMQDIYAAKNIKYGNSFTKTYQEYGNPVLCIRLEDKLSRIKQLLLHNVDGSSDESVIDSLTDLGNYAIMAIMELEKK